METKNNSIAAAIHLSALTQYFVPFGNFLFPLLIWGSKKDASTYIDIQGKRAINFQLSLLIYTIVLASIAVFGILAAVLQGFDFTQIGSDFNWAIVNVGQFTTLATVAIVALTILLALKVLEFFLIIYAAIKTSNGDDFKYPITINFIK